MMKRRAFDHRLDQERALRLAAILGELNELRDAEDRPQVLYAEIVGNLETARQQLAFAMEKYMSV